MSGFSSGVVPFQEEFDAIVMDNFIVNMNQEPSEDGRDLPEHDSQFWDFDPQNFDEIIPGIGQSFGDNIAAGQEDPSQNYFDIFSLETPFPEYSHDLELDNTMSLMDYDTPRTPFTEYSMPESTYALPDPLAFASDVMPNIQDIDATFANSTNCTFLDPQILGADPNVTTQFPYMADPLLSDMNGHPAIWSLGDAGLTSWTMPVEPLLFTEVDRETYEHATAYGIAAPTPEEHTSIMPVQDVNSQGIMISNSPPPQSLLTTRPVGRVPIPRIPARQPEPKEKVQCSICSTQLGRPGDLARHLRGQHKIGKPVAKCARCGFLSWRTDKVRHKCREQTQPNDEVQYGGGEAETPTGTRRRSSRKAGMRKQSARAHSLRKL